MNTCVINGFKICGPRSRQEFIDEVLTSTHILIALNAEKLYRRNSVLQDISQNGLAYPDGIGAVFALAQNGLRNVPRIPGSELWLDLISATEGTKKIYLIGATQEILDKTIALLQRDYPMIDIVGARNGFLKAEDKKKLFLEIKSKQPDLVFVAQGSPRQELLMKELYNLHRAIYVGLGGSFDVYTGSVKRAPAIFRDNGLEWFYRLITQPSRIKRQLALFPFAIEILFKRSD